MLVIVPTTPSAHAMRTLVGHLIVRDPSSSERLNRWELLMTAVAVDRGDCAPLVFFMHEPRHARRKALSRDVPSGIPRKGGDGWRYEEGRIEREEEDSTPISHAFMGPPRR